MKILVSACLLGENCKYNGGNNLNEKVVEFLKGHEVFPICPEVLGGLTTPRIPCEIVDGIVKNEEGISVDKEFNLGGERALKFALEKEIDMAILQPRSPSCGVNQIYDGTFTGKLVSGRGIFASLLADAGIKIIEASDIV